MSSLSPNFSLKMEESPPKKVPALTSDCYIVGTSSMPGKEIGQSSTVFPKPREALPKELVPPKTQRARKTLPNSRHNLTANFIPNSSQRNLEKDAATSPITKSILIPQPNADSTSHSPILSAHKLQLQQSHLKTSTPENNTGRKIPSLPKPDLTSDIIHSRPKQLSETGSVDPTQETPLKKATLAGMKLKFLSELQSPVKTRSVFSPNNTSDPLESTPPMPTLTVNTVSSTSTNDSFISNGIPSLVVEDFDDMPPLLRSVIKKKKNFSSSSNSENDHPEQKTNGEMGNDSKAIGSTNKISTNPEEVFHPPTPAPTPQMEDPNVEARMAALHGEPLEGGEVQIASNVDHEVYINSETSEPTVDRSDSDFDPTSVRKAVRQPKKPTPKTKTVPKVDVEKKPVKKTSGLAREVARLLQDEGAERIMQEMQEKEGKGASRRRSTVRVKGEFSQDTRQEKRYYDDEDEKIEKKTKRSRTDSLTVPSAESVSAVKGPLQNWQAVKSNKPGGKPIFYPIKSASKNSVDASKVRSRRSSSDSSTNVPKNEPKMEQKVEPTPRKADPPRFVGLSADACADSSSVHGALKDHLYWMTGQNQSKECSPTESYGELVEKLGANLEEMELQCIGSLLRVTLAPRSCKQPDSLTCATMKELTILLRKLKMDRKINLVLITSSGSNFCTGVDLVTLVSENKAERLQATIDTTSCIRDFITELANCDKIVVGAVHGYVNGLGVAMLPYFDYVYASEKSTFFLPYCELGQTSEGGLALAAQHANIAHSLILKMKYTRVTAALAAQYFLVSESIWQNNFQDVALQHATEMAREASTLVHSKKVRLATLRRELPAVLKEETTMLRATWMTEDFNGRAKKLLKSGKLLSS